LNQVSLRATKSSLVRDVKDAVIGLGVFTVNTSDLHVVLVSDSIELILVLCKERKLDVNRCSQSSTEIGWARGNVTKMVIMCELGNLLNESSGSGESGENSQNIGARLHGNDYQLVLFIDPNKESLGVIVEDTSSRWPISVETACIKEPISLLEQEVIINQLFLVFRRHSL